MDPIRTVALIALLVAALAAGQAAAWASGTRGLARLRRGPRRWDDKPPLSSNAALSRLLERVPGMTSLQLLQAQAGHGATTVSVVGLSFGLALLGETIVLLLGGGPVLGLLLAVPASAAPLGLIYARRRQRIREVERDLPSVLRSIFRLSASGGGPAVILHEAGGEAGGALGAELNRVFEEQRAGRPLHDALRAMADRVPGCMELRLLVTTVLLAEESGADLGEAVARLEGTVARRTELAAEVRSETARARLSAMVISSLPFVGLGLVFLVARKWVVEGWEDPAGRTMQTLAAGWVVVGLLVIRRLLRSPS